MARNANWRRTKYKNQYSTNPKQHLLYYQLLINTRRSKPKQQPSLFPAYVSVGHADGTLEIVVLRSRAEADEKGFNWVGRP